MANILYVNTTTSELQIAVQKGDALYRFVGSDDAKRHTAVLLPTVDKLLTDAGLVPKELTHIVCVSGPGSFTGIRVGAAFVNALKRSTGATVYAVTALDVLGRGDRIVSLDCKHDNYYCLVERGGQREYREMTSPEIAAVGLPRFEVSENTLSELIAYGQELVRCGDNGQGEVRPFYLKKSSAERENPEL